MRTKRFVLIVLSLGLLFTPGSVHADQAYQNIFLGGVAWRIPTQFVDGRPSQSKELHSLSLSFELPNFSAIDARDFLGVYPRDDRPILKAKISDDPNTGFGQPLLDRYINEALKDCSSCTVNPSSVGGTEYSTFDSVVGPPPYSHDGTLFRLYEYPDSGGQFGICNFAADGAPLPCQMTMKINDGLTILASFPIEYVSQGPQLMSDLKKRLAEYEIIHGAKGAVRPLAADGQPTCWAPVPGSTGAKIVPIKIGPTVWNIPEAFASAIGLDQSISYENISFYLKLPDLKPLSDGDPAPAVIRGIGNYIFISIDFDGRPWSAETENEMLSSLLQSTNRIGQNAFINFTEYQQANSKEALSYLYADTLDFVANENSSTDASFPPDWFTCTQYGGASNPLCIFRVNEELKSPANLNARTGGYRIQYDFSRDYFSRLIFINQCVENLYRQFRFGN